MKYRRVKFSPIKLKMAKTKENENAINVVDKKTKHREFLITEQEKFRENGVLTDVILECDGGMIQAHKLILSVSSPYFYNMFSVDLTEKNTGKVDFKQNSLRAMKIVIKFLYTGVINVELLKNEEILKEVLAVSHLMQIMPLFRYSWSMFEDTLNAENFVELVTLSILYDQNKIFDFVKDDLSLLEFRKICACPKITELSEEQVKVLITNLKKNPVIKYDHVVEFLLQWGQNGDREKEILNALELVNLNDLSDQSHQNLLWYTSGLDKLVTNDQNVTSLETEVSVGEQIHFYYLNQIQSYNVREKKWSDCRKIVKNNPADLSINVDLSMLYVDDCVYFTVEKHNELLMYDLDCNRSQLIRDSVNIESSKTRKIVYANDIYVWDEISFKRFNTNSNTWDLLKPFKADYDKSALISSKHGIFACKGKNVYLYNERKDDWEYKTYLRLIGDELAYIKNPAACKGKLYFMSSKSMYVCDVIHNSWIEKYFPGMDSVKSIPLYCEQPFLFFNDKKDRNVLWQFDPESDRWEKLPEGLKFPAWQCSAINQ